MLRTYPCRLEKSQSTRKSCCAQSVTRRTGVLDKFRLLANFQRNTWQRLFVIHISQESFFCWVILCFSFKKLLLYSGGHLCSLAWFSFPHEVLNDHALAISDIKAKRKKIVWHSAWGVDLNTLSCERKKSFIRKKPKLRTSIRYRSLL